MSLPWWFHGLDAGSAQRHGPPAVLLALCVLLAGEACFRESADRKTPEPRIVIFLSTIPATNLSADIEMDGVIVASVDRYNATTIFAPPGKHVFSITLEGYEAASKEILVLDSGYQKINFTLKAKPVYRSRVPALSNPSA